MKLNNWRAWFEAVFDTGVAVVINFPLNVCLLWFANRIDLSILQTSVMFTCVFTAVAIIRKYFIRNYFSKK